MEELKLFLSGENSGVLPLSFYRDAYFGFGNEEWDASQDDQQRDASDGEGGKRRKRGKRIAKVTVKRPVNARGSDDDEDDDDEDDDDDEEDDESDADRHDEDDDEDDEENEEEADKVREEEVTKFSCTGLSKDGTDGLKRFSDPTAVVEEEDENAEGSRSDYCYGGYDMQGEEGDGDGVSPDPSTKRRRRVDSRKQVKRRKTMAALLRMASVDAPL
jgi:hypothetical protein